MFSEKVMGQSHAVARHLFNVTKTFFCFLILINTTLISKATAHGQHHRIADRIICTINNVPYSQIEIESYMNVRETLRQDATTSDVVSADSWTMAVDAFVKDMVIYQDTISSGGMKASEQSIERSFVQAKKVKDEVERFKRRFSDLGVDDRVLRQQVVKILAVEMRRKSRQQQTVGSAPTNPSSQDASKVTKSERSISEGHSNSWEDDLQRSAVVRWYDGARTYQQLISFH